MASEHDMRGGGYGHGLSHCKYCLATDREIALVLGPVCPAERPAPPMADELVERVLADIASMMSQHVENWPYPRKIDTAIALISKTLDAALTDAVPRDVAESWKAKAENLSAARKEAATTITRLTEANAAQAREIEAWEALAHKAFHAADVVLAPICADVGKEILHPENCPDLVSVMFADGVQIPAQHYADLYWATHPDLIHALTGGQP